MIQTNKYPKVRAMVDADDYRDLYNKYLGVLRDYNNGNLKLITDNTYIDIANYLFDVLIKQELYADSVMLSYAKTDIELIEDGIKLDESLADWVAQNSIFQDKTSLEKAKSEAESRLGDYFSVFEAIIVKKLKEKRDEVFKRAYTEMVENEGF